MNANNGAARLRRELLVELARATLALEDPSSIPLRLFPRKRAAVRCCIYRDRAIVRYRLIAQMGFSVEEETDESKSLSSYASEGRARAVARTEPRAKGAAAFLTLIDEACNSCLRARHEVTNLCQGCLARPCTSACPKSAISVGGRASIDPEKCVNCGLCLKSCPYHAIVKLSAPCEEACPVDAVSMGEDGKERIDGERCILCGKCMVECPFGAIMERGEMVEVLHLLATSKREAGARPLVAIYAPAMAAQFPSGHEKLEPGLLALGFAAAYEAARGADLVIAEEGRELAERMREGRGLMTSSCCPAYVQLVRKHAPALAERVSPAESPMLATARLAAKEHPGAALVFIGPCVAKKREAAESGLLHFVLNAEELGAMLVASGIDLDSLPALASAAEMTGIKASPDGRGFAASGGVARAIEGQLRRIGAPPCSAACLNGLGKKGVATLKLYASGTLKADFLEVMACEGGCIAGPASLASQKLALPQLEAYVKAGDPMKQ